MALEPRSRDGIGAIQDLLACPACGGALALAGEFAHRLERPWRHFRRAETDAREFFSRLVTRP
jgi:hypothetical protein